MLFAANIVLFQLTWLACVAGAAAGHWWLGPLALVGFAIWQLSVSHARTVDLKLMLIAAALGMVVDSALVIFGLLSFASPWPWSSLAPAWIIALWMAFALTLNHSLAGLRDRPGLAALFGLFGGPLAYWIAVVVWGGAEFTAAPTLVLTVLGLIWALVTPLLLAISGRLLAATRPLALAPAPHAR